MAAELYLFDLRDARVGVEQLLGPGRSRRKEEHGQPQAGCSGQAACRQERTLVRAPHLRAVDAQMLEAAQLLFLSRAQKDPVGEAAEVGRCPAREHLLAQGGSLRGDERLTLAAACALAQVLESPFAVVGRQGSVEERPEERNGVRAALHRSSPSGSSSPRYSRNFFCIFNRAWKSRLITVPLRMPSTLANTA